MAQPSSHLDFIDRLHQALAQRQRQHLTHSDVALRLEALTGRRISKQAVQKWWAGSAFPSHENLKALAAWLRVSPEWLLFGGAEGMATAAEEPVAPYHDIVCDIGALSPEAQAIVRRIVSALLIEEKSRSGHSATMRRVGNN